jgi:hypothetical protein
MKPNSKHLGIACPLWKLESDIISSDHGEISMITISNFRAPSSIIRIEKWRTKRTNNREQPNDATLLRVKGWRDIEKCLWSCYNVFSQWNSVNRNRRIISMTADLSNVRQNISTRYLHLKDPIGFICNTLRTHTILHRNEIGKSAKQCTSVK